MPDAVLPALLVLAVEREALHDELVDAVERDAFVRLAHDRHGDEGDVAVRRLHHVLLTGAGGSGGAGGGGRGERISETRRTSGTTNNSGHRCVRLGAGCAQHLRLTTL